MFARTPFLASLMTSVSIRYIGHSLLVHALEVLIPADVGHRGKNVREALAIGLVESFLQYGSMLRFSASVVTCVRACKNYDAAPTSEPLST